MPPTLTPLLKVAILTFTMAVDNKRIMRFVLVVVGVCGALILCEVLCALALLLGIDAHQIIFWRAQSNPSSTKYEYELPSGVEVSQLKNINFPHEPYKASDYIYDAHYSDQDGEIYFPKPDYSGVAVFKRKADQKIIYQHSVHTDHYGHRLTHPREQVSQRPMHLLLLGCSYIWGDTISDEDTLPWQLQNKQNKFTVYNLGFSSYNPGPIYGLIKKHQFLDGIEPRDGVAFYFVVAFHVTRFFRTTSVRTPDDYPRFVYKDGDLQFEPRFTIYNRIVDVLQNLYVRSHFYKLFGIDFPLITKNDYSTFAKALKLIEKSYLEKFAANNKFVVVLYPQDYSYIDLSVLKAVLNEEKIHFVDWSDSRILFDPDRPLVHIDSHPNRDANGILADLLVKQLLSF